ncbi:MAG: hypothetical protein ABF899_01610 [Oenococcus sp.]|uniref:hypothetical protein n=1 Tax=Oenococcus sp. TaxID=1979414 RepID=UPI0039E9C877
MNKLQKENDNLRKRLSELAAKYNAQVFDIYALERKLHNRFWFGLLIGWLLSFIFGWLIQ